MIVRSEFHGPIMITSDTGEHKNTWNIWIGPLDNEIESIGKESERNIDPAGEKTNQDPFLSDKGRKPYSYEKKNRDTNMWCSGTKTLGS